jgi:hypothetical protein
VVVGLGVAVYLLGVWLTTIGSHSDTGWTGYAPTSNSNFTVFNGGLHPWVRLLIWLALILLWVAASLVLLKEPAPSHFDE